MTSTAKNPNTNKTLVTARKSFEAITGKKVRKATVADVEVWLNGLRMLGRSDNTCRTYLSFVKKLAGLEVELPKRTRHYKRDLTNVELKAMLSVAPEKAYALLTTLILCGPAVLNWTWRTVAQADPDLSLEARLVLIAEASRRGSDVTALLTTGNIEAHFVNGVDLDEIIFPHDYHEINRRLKAIARKAGIGDNDINVTALKYAHARLMAEYKQDTDRIAAILGIDFKTDCLTFGREIRRRIQPSQKAEPRLHGIGRRRSSVI